jgi:hypothetical protein
MRINGMPITIVTFLVILALLLSICALIWPSAALITVAVIMLALGMLVIGTPANKVILGPGAGTTTTTVVH